MKKKSFLYGAIILTVSALISKILGAIYRIPLTNLLGTEGVGLYQMIFPVYSLFLVLSSSGIPVAVSRLISEQVALNNYYKVKKIFKSTLILMFFIGVFFSGLILVFAPLIASIQGNELATLGYLGIAPAVIISTLVAGFRGYFQGLENMKPTAISEVLEQISKVALGLLLANLLLSQGIEFGVLGAILGVTLGECVSLISIIIIYFVNKRKDQEQVNNQIKNEQNQESYFLIIKHIFLKSLPITFGSIVLPITLVIDSILIINLLVGSGFNLSIATSLFGIQTGVVNSLVNLPMIISYSIATAMLPTLTASKAKKNNSDVEKNSILSLKIVWLIALPCFVGLMLLAPDITRFLYAGGLNSGQVNEMQVANSLIRIGAVSVIYMSFLKILLAILHALDKSFLAVKSLFLGSIVKVGLTLVLVSVNYINIYGATLASALSYSLMCFTALILVKKQVNLSFNKSTFFVKPLISVGFMSVVIIVIKNLFALFLSSNLATLLSIVLGGSAYVVAILILKVFDLKQTKYFKTMQKLSNRLKFLKRFV